MSSLVNAASKYNFSGQKYASQVKYNAQTNQYQIFVTDYRTGVIHQLSYSAVVHAVRDRRFANGNCQTDEFWSKAVDHAQRVAPVAVTTLVGAIQTQQNARTAPAASFDTLVKIAGQLKAVNQNIAALSATDQARLQQLIKLM